MPAVCPITVKSEGGAEATRVRMSETPADPERAGVVVFETGETAASVLEDLTLTGGKGTKYGTEYWMEGGGGVLCVSGSSPTVANCTISGNWTRDDRGGGVSCSDSSPTLTLTNCILWGNTPEC